MMIRKFFRKIKEFIKKHKRIFLFIGAGISFALAVILLRWKKTRKSLKIISVILAILLALFGSSQLYFSVKEPEPPARATSWLTGWSYRKKITIDNTNIDSDLSDFPLLVKISSDSDIGDEARSDGYDIRFTSDDGSTLLSYERESWSGGGGSPATAIFWVKVPTISSSSPTDIYIYYGKADA
ncbi:MAG: DUF2341 domain-containing protein, partial [Candidatus Thorarchaeota archaeon]